MAEGGDCSNEVYSQHNLLYPTWGSADASGPSAGSDYVPNVFDGANLTVDPCDSYLDFGESDASFKNEDGSFTTGGPGDLFWINQSSAQAGAGSGQNQSHAAAPAQM